MGSIREHTKKSGEKSYHAEVRLKGFPTQRASFRTKSQAKKWIQDTESAIRDGRYQKMAVARRYNVSELIDRFINQYLSRDTKYKHQKVLLLERWRTEIGEVLLSDLTPSRLAEIRDILLEEITPRGTKRSSGTVNRYIAAFSKALTFAVKELGWLQENPMFKISKPKEARGRDRYLTRDEIEMLLEACKESKNENLYPIIQIAVVTGMRYGEIVNLRWKNINFENRFLTIEQTKNGSQRVIPLTGQLIKILKECPSFGNEPQSLIFSTGKPSTTNRTMSIRKSFATALKKANIENFRFHDLRHTAASHMAMKGASQGELMEILGHRTPTQSVRYQHFNRKHIETILERSSEIIDNKGEIDNDN